jgi:hypothetical protein
MQEPGLEISRLFNVVTADVLDATDGHQRPYQYGSNPTREEFFLKPPTPIVATPTTPSIPDSTLAATIDATTTVDQLTPLIAALPEGPLKERAKARAQMLKQVSSSDRVAPIKPAARGETPKKGQGTRCRTFAGTTYCE